MCLAQTPDANTEGCKHILCQIENIDTKQGVGKIAAVCDGFVVKDVDTISGESLGRSVRFVTVTQMR